VPAHARPARKCEEHKGVSRPRRGGRPRKADVQQVEAGARVRREMHTPPIPASAHPLAVYDGRKYLGHVVDRGEAGVEAFTADDRSAALELWRLARGQTPTSTNC
jgi:hypothetical protein